MSINKVLISGNLTRDAELRSTASGTSILAFGVAVNDRRRNQKTSHFKPPLRRSLSASFIARVPSQTEPVDDDEELPDGQDGDEHAEAENERLHADLEEIALRTFEEPADDVIHRDHRRQSPETERELTVVVLSGTVYPCSSSDQSRYC